MNTKWPSIIPVSQDQGLHARRRWGALRKNGGGEVKRNISAGATER